MLSLDYMLNEHENKYFDRKSAKIKPSVLAELVAAFANADGGTIVIGITDKSRKLEGINFIGEEALNNLITTPKDCCKPMAQFEYEFLNIKNKDGFQDRLLLLHIKKVLIILYAPTTIAHICESEIELKNYEAWI